MKRAFIHRAILGLALAGMVLALHLWIQKSRGFDQGCLGLSRPQAVSSEGCTAVSELPASFLFGVSNAAWGYAFYFALAVVSFGKILASPRWARRLQAAGAALSVVGLVYSGYLVYEMAAAQAWCVLCLTSAAMVTALAALHGVVQVRGGFAGWEEPARTEEFRVAVVTVFGAGSVLLGVLMFVNRLGTRPLDQGETAEEITRMVGRSLPVYIDSAKLSEMRACHIDWSAPTLDFGKLGVADAPFAGSATGLPVVVFYDPNCPFCKDHHAHFREMVEAFHGRARVTIVPRILWEESTAQVQALKLAETGGKYFELWELMFKTQPGPRKSLSWDQIADMFRELGLDASNLPQRASAVRSAVVAQQAQIAGIRGTPAVYISGKKVWGQNVSQECVGTLVERFAGNPAALGAPATEKK